MSGRRILLTGLPSGVGCSRLAIELAHALADLGRSTAVAGALKDMPRSFAPRPAGKSPHGVVFGLGGGNAWIPLELLQPAGRQESLAALAPDCEFLLLDRFTGLAIADSDWYRQATEVIVIIDGQPESESKALHLLGRIDKAWPTLPVYLVFNRVASWPDWQVLGRDFNQKSEKVCRRRFPALGGMPITAEMARCRQEGRSLLDLYPNHPCSRNLKLMARQLLHLEVIWAHDPKVLVHSPNRSSQDARHDTKRSVIHAQAH